MIYDVSLGIDYDYDAPAVSGRHLLCLMPADIPGRQRLVAGDIAIDPAPVERLSTRDFYGNAVTEIAFAAPHDRLHFRMTARVENTDAGGLLDVSPPVAALDRDLGMVLHVGPDAPHHFIAASPRVPEVTDITAYARAACEQADTVVTAVRTLGRAIHADFRFDSDATSVDTPIATAFGARHGVCQDFTHIMIAGLRGIGIPAGYVSGYLRTLPPPGAERLEGADAMHAWVRAWCGLQTGWIEFDPTNAMDADADHIVVGYGRDYADVAPVRGVSRAAGQHSTTQAVDVVPLSA